ncbi:MAG: DUF11 domain-containing protein [Betaproteobacteria bacterium]
MVASILVAVLVSPVPAYPAGAGPAATAATPGRGVRAMDPVGLTARYAGRGWLGIVQADAGSTGSDVDSDQSTVNSSRASLTVPAGATVEWAGLHWGGDQATRTDGSPPRCAGASDLAAPPAAPDQTGAVAVSVNNSPYQTVNAVDVAHSGTAFQAYADVTAALRPLSGQAQPTNLAVTVANVQIATGPGCAGGWSLMLVYAFPNGPDKTSAPIYQSVGVYDALLPAGATANLGGLVAPARGPVNAGLTGAVLIGGIPVGLTLGGQALPNVAAGGYQAVTTGLPGGSIPDGTASTGLTVSGGGESYAGAVLAVGIALPISVSLPVSATFSPTTVAVGAMAQLTVTVKNDGDVPDAGVVVTAPLPTGMSLAANAAGYDPSTGAWNVGTVQPHTTATLALSVRVDASGSFSSSARVTGTAVPLNQNPPPAPSTATIVVETIVAPTQTDSGNQPAGLDQPVAPPARGWPMPPGPILFGIGLFGLGLLILLIILVQRRSNA